MTDKISINKAFNNLLFGFFDDLITIFPEQEDIATAKTSMMTFKQMNPSILIKSWFKVVYTPYAEVINAGNVNFFFEKDYSADLHKLPNAKEFIKVINKIREPICTMDTTNRGHCADYILKLSKLSEIYNSM
jgi:hypothetical protein